MRKIDAKCSVITPRGEGGIGVIMLFGKDATRVLEACFEGTKRGAREIPPGRLAHGRIVQNEAVIDEVLVARFEGGRGWANKPCYEVNCHGGAVAVQSVLQRFEKEDARLLAWREVMELGVPGDPDILSSDAIRIAALRALPEAETRAAAKMLLSQASGVLCRELSDIASQLGENAVGAVARLERLLGTSDAGMAMLSPPAVMLAGPPNAGKSTLLNALLGRERVIVHPMPGTTRDVVKDRMSIGGMPFDIMDSAGLHDGSDELDAAAVRHTYSLIGEADVIFFLFDVREDPAMVLRAASDAPVGNSRILYVANKCDLLGPGKPGIDGDLLPYRAPLIHISAKKQEGLESLEEFLLGPYGDIIERCECGQPVLFTQEQREVVAEALGMAASRCPAQAAGVMQAAGVRFTSP